MGFGGGVGVFGKGFKDWVIGVKMEDEKDNGFRGKGSKRMSMDRRAVAAREYILSGREVSVDELCGHFGCSYSTMCNVLEEEGICLLPKSYHNENRVLWAYRDGYRMTQEVGKVAGLSSKYAWALMKKLGLERVGVGRPAGTGGIKKRDNLVLSGDDSVIGVSEKEGVSRSAICGYINRRGLREKYREARLGKGFRVWEKGGGGGE